MSGPVIAVDDVDFAYNHVPVLEGVSLTVEPGQFVALVGPNGSGKSTLVRIMLGLLSPRRGTATLFGDRPGHHRQHRGRLGFVPQRPGLADGLSATVEDIVASGRLARTGWLRRDPRRVEAVESALASVDLTHLRGESVATLSGGQQQRTFIARALAGEPELLVLDEPVAGLDAESQQTFRRSLCELVHERGGSVLLVSHELSAVADDIDRILVLKRHIRFDGPPADLIGTGVSLGLHDHDLPLWLEGVV